jgi:hypothetical protein
LIDGLTQKQPSLSSFTFDNTTHQTADIIAKLKERIDTANAVALPRATWQTAVKANRDLRSDTDPIIAGVRRCSRRCLQAPSTRSPSSG